MILLIAACLVLSIVLNLCVAAALLKGVARWCRIGPVKYPRALLVMGLATVATLAPAGVALAVEGRWPLVWLLAFVVQLAVLFGVLRVMLQTSLRRAVAAGILVLIGNAAFSWGLTLALRASVCEAFSVPTGSMVPTIYGEHISLKCPVCGYRYARSADPLRFSRYRPASVQSLCPNCADVTSLETGDSPQVEAGDRLLADKLTVPTRWQTVIINDPSTPGIRFVKRLVGMPGEFVEIINGDIYLAPLRIVREKDPGLIAEAERLRHDIHLYARGQSTVTLDEVTKRYEAINRRLIPYLRIQRKGLSPPGVQEAPWLPVFDQDFVPPTAPGATRPATQVGWSACDSAAQTAWDTSSPQMRFKSTGDAVLAIEFSGKTITDTVAYNGARPYAEPALVGDVRLSFVATVESGNGGLTLRLNRDADVFTARLQADGTVEIQRDASPPGTPAMIGRSHLAPFVPGKPVSIQFQNLDFRVSLSVDGREVIASNDEQCAPRVADLLARGDVDPKRLPTRAQIGAYGLQCRLEHVRLDRDTYYRSLSMVEPRSMPSPSADAIPATNPFYGWPGWGTQGFPIMLRDGTNSECFLLGDNSLGAKDGRLWWEVGPHLASRGEGYQAGTLPFDQIIGVGRFVYWPPSRWHRLD